MYITSSYGLTHSGLSNLTGYGGEVNNLTFAQECIVRNIAEGIICQQEMIKYIFIEVPI